MLSHAADIRRTRTAKNRLEMEMDLIWCLNPNLEQKHHTLLRAPWKRLSAPSPRRRTIPWVFRSSIRAPWDYTVKNLYFETHHVGDIILRVKMKCKTYQLMYILSSSNGDQRICEFCSIAWAQFCHISPTSGPKADRHRQGEIWTGTDINAMKLNPGGGHQAKKESPRRTHFDATSGVNLAKLTPPISFAAPRASCKSEASTLKIGTHTLIVCSTACCITIRGINSHTKLTPQISLRHHVLQLLFSTLTVCSSVCCIKIRGVNSQN